jgi:hypothetical protein
VSLVSAFDLKMEADGDECDIRAPEVGNRPSSSGIAPKAKATKDKKKKGAGRSDSSKSSDSNASIANGKKRCKGFCRRSKVISKFQQKQAVCTDCRQTERTRNTILKQSTPVEQKWWGDLDAKGKDKAMKVLETKKKRPVLATR